MDRNHRDFKSSFGKSNPNFMSLGDSGKDRFTLPKFQMSDNLDSYSSGLRSNDYGNPNSLQGILPSNIDFTNTNLGSISLPKSEFSCNSDSGISCSYPVSSNISVFAGIGMDGNPRAPMPDHPDIPGGRYGEIGFSYKF